MDVCRVLYVMANAKRGGAEQLTTSMMLHSTSDYLPFAYLLDNGPIVHELRKSGIAVTSFSEVFGFRPRLRNPIHFIKVVRHISKIIRLNRIQLVHSVMSYGHLFGGVAAILSRVPNVWYEHGPVSAWNRTAQLLPTKILFTNSNYTLAQCKKRLIIAAQTKVIMPAVESFKTQDVQDCRKLFRERYHIDSECIVIGIVGRISPEKGIDLFLEAGRDLIYKNSRYSPNNLRLMLIGGSFKESDKTYSKLLNDILDRLDEKQRRSLRPFIIETGYVHPAWKTIAACDIVANTSRVPEGFGLTLAEGLNLGCNIIAPDQGAPLEFLTENDRTTFFKTGDKSSLVDAFETSIIKSGKKTDRQTHVRPLTKMISELEESYREILSPSIS